MRAAWLAVMAGVLLGVCDAAPTAAPGDPLLEVPPGYIGNVVLHVAYGGTPDTVGVNWGREGREGVESETWEPSSVDALQVVGDRFYGLDRTSHQVKVFRSAGILEWATEEIEGLHSYAVTSDRRVLVFANYANATRFICLDAKGRHLWTKRAREVLPPANQMRLAGLARVSDETFSSLEWTGYGFSALVSGRNPSGRAAVVRLTFTAEGMPGRLFGAGVTLGPDRTTYEFDAAATGPVLPDLARSPVRKLIRRSEDGRVLGRATLNYATDRGIHLRRGETITGTRRDGKGGLVVSTYVRLPRRVPLRISGRLGPVFGTTPVQRRIWRFSALGQFREVWGFPAPPFARGGASATVAADGAVYYLRYGDTGIDAVRYSSDSIAQRHAARRKGSHEDGRHTRAGSRHCAPPVRRRRGGTDCHRPPAGGAAWVHRAGGGRREVRGRAGGRPGDA